MKLKIKTMTDIRRLIEDRPEDVRNMAKNIFDEIDTDKSGEIDRDEMRDILQTMAIQLGRPEPTEADLDKEIDRYDQNGDGLIDCEEFTCVILDILKGMAGM